MIYILNWHPHERAGFDDIKDIPWVKFIFVYDAAYMEELVSYLNRQDLRGAQLVRSDRMLCEILPRESGKGRGVQRLCELLGVSRDRLIGMGDYYNDRELLEYAGFSAVPANAPADIQAVSSLTTKADNLSGAVAEAIDYIMSHRNAAENGMR